jgi:hypothetical protein
MAYELMLGNMFQMNNMEHPTTRLLTPLVRSTLSGFAYIFIIINKI